jgi:16S rRNA (cytosine1402-N4)-methyltransferase
MRMAQQGVSAADLVNEASEERLADIFYYYGEDRASRRLARAVVAARAEGRIETTKRLAEIIARAAPGKPGDIHPATRAFQGLRIAVNDELGELARALAAAEAILKPGGVLAIVTFHSLEDRIVKQFFAERAGRGQAQSRLLPGEPARPQPTFAIDGPAMVAPTFEETSANPRARSAKLRAARRTDAPSRGADPKFIAAQGLPEVPLARAKPSRRK